MQISQLQAFVDVAASFETSLKRIDHVMVDAFSGRRVIDMKPGDRGATSSWAMWRDTDGAHYIDGWYSLLTEAADPKAPIVHLRMTDDGLVAEGYFDYQPTALRYGDPQIKLAEYRQIGEWAGPLYKP